MHEFLVCKNQYYSNTQIYFKPKISHFQVNYTVAMLVNNKIELP